MSKKKKAQVEELPPTRTELAFGAIEDALIKGSRSIPLQQRTIIGFIGILLSLTSFFFAVPALRKLAFEPSYSKPAPILFWGVGSVVALLASFWVFIDTKE